MKRTPSLYFGFILILITGTFFWYQDLSFIEYQKFTSSKSNIQTSIEISKIVDHEL